MNHEEIAAKCSTLISMKTRGELGKVIADIVLSYSPRDLQQMHWNFSGAIQDINPELRKNLEETITGYLQGTYQAIRLMHQQASFDRMREPPAMNAGDYWRMVAVQCSSGDAEQVRLRFLKFLLAGFCMFVQELPGHPVGMPFPGGDKANDVDAALCPFCPALQTPEIGYLKPPVIASRHRKQEYIRETYDRHHFNG